MHPWDSETTPVTSLQTANMGVGYYHVSTEHRHATCNQGTQRTNETAKATLYASTAHWEQRLNQSACWDNCLHNMRHPMRAFGSGIKLTPRGRSGHAKVEHSRAMSNAALVMGLALGIRKLAFAKTPVVANKSHTNSASRGANPA